MSELMLHDDRDTIIAGLREQLRQTREELTSERSKGGQIERGAQALRTALTPLYGALQHIFGETDAMGISGSPAQNSPSMDSRKAAVWESWKQRLPGIPSRFIDALMLHGELTQDQLRIHAQCARGSVADAVSKLWKAGIINKNGGRVSLKEL